MTTPVTTPVLTGRAVLVVLAGAVPVLLLPRTATALVWSALVLAAIGLDLVLAASPRAVALARAPVPAVRQGGTAVAGVSLTNTGRRRLRGTVRDAWQPSAGAQHTRWPVDLAAGRTAVHQVALRPTRRGDRRAEHVSVRSWGPLGLAARQATLPAPGRVRVLPPFDSRRHLPSRLARLRELDGRTAVRTRGRGTEFDSLREYVDGDDARSIDWRATARRRQLVVRTWQPERDRRVLLVLDTSRTSAGRVQDAPRLDAAMDAALLLVALAERAGDRVQLLAIDRRVRARAGSPGRGAGLAEVMAALAPLEPDLVEADWATIARTVLTTVNRRALVVLLTGLEPAPVTEGLLPVLRLLTSRHHVVLASVADPRVAELAADRRDAYAVYGAAAAERALADRAAVAADLATAGVQVLDEPPQRLPTRLADLYLELKGSGRL